MCRRDMGNTKLAEEELLKVMSRCVTLFYQLIFDECQLHTECKCQLGDLHPDFIALTHELAVFHEGTGDPRSALSLNQRMNNGIASGGKEA